MIHPRSPDTVTIDRARRVAVTDPIATARPYDYADAFELTLTERDRSSPEEWVLAGLERVPAWVKRIAGAEEGAAPMLVVSSDSDAVVLEDTDALMETIMIGRNVTPERRVLTTVLRYKRPRVARAAWAVVGILHRRTARRVVMGAQG